MARQRISKAATAAEVTSPLLSELGVSGLRRWGGTLDEEFLPELKGARGRKVLREMALNDPTVGAVLFTFEQLIRQLHWTVVAADESPEGILARDLVKSALFEDMSHTWQDALSEILSMLVYGWCYMETVYKYRGGPGEIDPTRRSRFTDGKLGWRKWAIRAQETLWEWAFDPSGGIQGLWQTPWPGTGQGGTSANVLIPIDKALLFRTRSDRNSPEGRSLLRTAYRCFTPDHDVLTRRGWVPIAQVTEQDRLATLNPMTDAVEWRPAVERQSYEHRGALTHISGKHLDLLVTGNHDLWVRPGRRAEWGFTPAERVTGSMRMRRDLGQHHGDAPAVFELPEVRWRDRQRRAHAARGVPIDAWAEFLGFWLADGSAGIYGADQRFRVTLYQQEGPTAEWLRGLLKRCGFAWNESRGHAVTHFGLCGASQLRAALLPYAKPKRVPPYVRIWDPALIRQFLDAHLRGDGSVVERTRLHFTIVEALADDLHELAVLSGAVASKRRSRAGMFWVTRGRIPRSGSRCQHISTVWYEGPVHCVTVPPHHLIYVRRNGQGCWTGNSWYFKKKIEEIEGIGIERDLTGLPVLTPPERGVNPWDDKDPKATAVKAAAERVVRNVKRDEQEGLFKPYGWTLELLTTGGRRQFDTTAIIDRYDTRIAMSCLADFILLGHQRVGSWALSSDKTELCALAVGGIADGIATVVNRHASPRLLRLNGLPEALTPTLQHGDLETPDLDALGTFVQRLASVQAIRLTPALETALLEAANLPIPTIQDPTVGKKLRKGIRLTKRERQMVETMASVREAITVLKTAAVKLAATLPTA